MASNGQLDPNTLRVLPGFAPYGAARNFLPASATTLSNLGTAAMAQDYANMRAAFPTAFGVLTYAEAYRSLTMQQQRWKEHLAGGPLAARPGTSNHGTARAMDFRNGIGFGGAAWEWMKANAARFGFTPISSEKWHWEHLSDTVTSHITTAASTGKPTPVPTLEGAEMAVTFAALNGNSTRRGLLKKGWVFAIDHGAGTIRHITNGKEVETIKNVHLKYQGGNWLFIAGNTPWELDEAGMKRIGW